MGERKITCTNNDGDSMTFTEDGFTPFLLYAVDGVYDQNNNVSMTENTMSDGAVYLGSVAKFRNIVITLKDTELDTNFSENREMLNKIFKRGTTGTLLFEEDDNSRSIEYYVESFTSEGKHTTRLHTVSLICPDPFFYDPTETEVKFAEWVSDFEFIHEFTSSGEEFAHYTAAYKDIYNDSADENKELIITTHTGNKHVLLVSGGVTTEINQYMTEDSTFIQLMRGDNNIGFLATSGSTSLVISMSYRVRYVRA